VDLGLADKVVLVAGSSRGIGLATARAFVDEGSRTAITGRDEGALEEARSELANLAGPDRVMAVAGDVADPATIDRVLARIADRWGPLDCLVANVGSGRGPRGWSAAEDEWQRLFDQNFNASRRVVQAALPAMTTAGNGSIVLVASIVGLESIEAPLAYSAAKAALVNYAKNLARQVGRVGVRVNVVAPGNILFPGGSWERHLSERRDEVLLQIAAEVPLNRFGRPEDIADLIAFLSSERAAFITGSCVVADGGQTRGI
jgi:3-oxoacyl-[acyl-carrier protein] reductase